MAGDNGNSGEVYVVYMDECNRPVWSQYTLEELNLAKENGLGSKILREFNSPEAAALWCENPQFEY